MCCVNTSSKRSNIDYTLGYFITLNKPFVQSTHRNIVLSDTFLNTYLTYLKTAKKFNLNFGNMMKSLCNLIDV